MQKSTENVLVSPKYRAYKEIGIKESNDYVRILTGSSQMANYAHDVLLWSPYGIGQTIIFSSRFFLLLRSFLFPRLISAVAGRRLDVYHTSTHGVALARI